jgi:hypothetical protein
MARTFPLTELTFTTRQAVHVINVSFTLLKFVGETVSDRDTQHSLKSQLTVTTVFALAILGIVTIIRNDPISVMPPKVAKASTSAFLSHVIITGIMALTFANVKTAYEVYFMAHTLPKVNNLLDNNNYKQSFLCLVKIYFRI